MAYDLVFEFPDADVFGVRASRIISDPREETVRIDIATGQLALSEEKLRELMERLETEEPSYVSVIGEAPGYELLQKARQLQMDVLVRFEPLGDARFADDVFVPAQIFEV